jgi:hypothetical protein
VKALEFHLVHLVAFLHKATQSIFIIYLHISRRQLTLKNRGGTTTEPIYLGLPLSHKSATRSGFFEFVSKNEFYSHSYEGYRAHVAQRIEKISTVIFLLRPRQRKNTHPHKNHSDTYHCSCSQHGRVLTLASRLVSSWLCKHGHGHKSTSHVELMAIIKDTLLKVRSRDG